jgi:hypothetical protein
MIHADHSVHDTEVSAYVSLWNRSLQRVVCTDSISMYVLLISQILDTVFWII